ncbi:hypothetical protein IL306_004681 [Fusarium sp. DS 682]|nr:hypothetical protein IL306_004681 [Fusarium sp. DS 682]
MLTYRGRFNLNSEAACSQKIFQGPLHIESGGDEHVWPFAITLPKYVDPRYLNGGGQDESYLPLSATDHILPSTYTLRSTGYAEAFVEYFLKATLRITGQGHINMAEAVLPFKVMNLSPDPPIADFGLKGSQSRHSITTYRLIPGMEDAKLSFSQKMKQSFSTSSVPEYVFNLLVDVPTIIQLDNPTPIPFKLRIVPDLNGTSEIIRDIPQKARLNSVSIQIGTSTEVICKGTLLPPRKEKREQIDLCVMGAIPSFLGRIKDDIYIPCTSDYPPIDIGAMIDLRLGQLGPGFPHLRGGGSLRFSPSFTTYNIRHSHRLSWEVQGEIAGERFKTIGAVAVKLLIPSDERGQPSQKDPAVGAETEGAGESEPGPSRLQRNESWIQPPDEDDAPPSFSQVVKEDAGTHMADKGSA